MGKYGEITFEAKLRPCLVCGRRALFHRWFLDRFDEPQALVELEDGGVFHVGLNDLRFLDSKNTFADYAWPDKEDNHEEA